MSYPAGQYMWKFDPGSNSWSYFPNAALADGAGNQLGNASCGRVIFCPTGNNFWVFNPLATTTRYISGKNYTMKDPTGKVWTFGPTVPDPPYYYDPKTKTFGGSSSGGGGGTGPSPQGPVLIGNQILVGGTLVPVDIPF